MIRLDLTMSIQILYHQGMSKKKIAKHLKLSINTVRKYINEGIEPKYKKRISSSKLDPYKAYIEQRVSQATPIWLPATVIYREIQALGYQGKDRILRYYLNTLKPKHEDLPTIRFETEPGLQMQVDWAELRRKPRLAAFIATLGFSRVSYVEFVEDEKLETLLSCHEHAFNFFGGVTKSILYDNMKTIVIERDAYGEGQHRFQKGLWDFAKHYNFIPKLCRPYRAQTKGKVERFIHYFRYSFYHPLITKLKQVGLELDINTANYEVISWLNNVANIRTHGTTGYIPYEQLKKEKQYLQAVPKLYCGQVSIKLKSKHVSVNTGFMPINFSEIPSSLQHPLSIYDSLLCEGGLV